MKSKTKQSAISYHVSCILHPASAEKSCIVHRASCIVIFLTFFAFLSGIAHAAPQMADYCYLPPFVTDPNTPPNIMVVYERGTSILKRTYSTTYTSSNTYYGFFDTTAGANYSYDSSNDYFYKPTSACTIGRSNNCFSGNMLNWALMSSVDLTRKVLIGFGWPDTGASTGAGNVFTYSGDFNGSRTPISYGQWEDGNTLRVEFTDTTNNFTYSFCLSKFTGSNPTGLTIRAKDGSAAPSCTGTCNAAGNCSTLVNNGQVAMKFSKVCSNDSTKVCTVNGDCSSGGVCQEEVRYGIIQKYADKDQNYTYDSDAPRFGMRRWSNGADKQEDILCDNATTGNCTSTSKTDLFKGLLNAISKAPPNDGTTLHLGEMMEDITDYFSDTYNATIAYKDNDAYTQTPYKWSTDPAKSCRKTFALFLTSGASLGQDSDKISGLPAACSSLTYTDAFSTNTCYAYNTDLSSETGTQNIRTYVVHTNFLSDAANSAALTYASRTVGGGEYIAVSDPATLQSKIEEAILNILSTSASASTVATLTTQTRESSTLTQAYFYPKREGTPLRWLGYLRLLWSDSGANLREDTLNTGWLDLKKDNILSFYYDPTLVAYKGRTFAVKNESPYLTIDTCDPTDSKVTTKLNDNILAIWNAQDKLLARSPTDRIIKVGIGNTAGVVTGSDCTTTSGSGCYNFTTSLASTLKPYWNYASYCSNVTTRWCGGTTQTEADNSCNFCNINTSRTCPSRADSACYYCSGNTSLACPSVGASGAGSLCYFDYGTCTAESNTKCSGDTSRSCTIAADCIDDYGTCTADTCRKYDTAPTFSCNVDCDTDNCATQVIKFALGYDYPRNASSAVASPGSGFRIRSQCTADGDCTGGTCGDKKCRATSASCTSDSDCTSGDACVGTCSSASYDVTKTLKLGDIVYSTPRISPNSAVNGYDVTYSDTSYTNFKGSNTVKNATPIVIVGANDGMVHAFQVSKIKDISPASTTGGGVTDGYQTARFSDYPPTDDSAPPSDIGKELWAYIPFNAVPYLKWYCDESYCHIPMVDARFTVVDASIDYDADGTVESTEGKTATEDRTCDADGTNCVWRRLLIGAMGVGGRQITVGSNTWSSSVFVLDITDPTSPKLLWERPLPDGTLTAGTPAVVRLGDTAKNGTWYLLFGSGPTSVTTNAVNYKSSNARIYVFDLRTGAQPTGTESGLDVGASGVASGDLMAVDFDSDYQVDDIYFGTYGGSGASQTGKFYRLRIRDGDNTGPPVTPNYQTTVSDWDIETVVNAGRPIFASPEIAQDSSGNKWLYFGTGLYLSLEHAAVTSDNEYLYGVKETDACWKSGGASCTYSTPSASFLDTTNISFTGAKAVEAGCFCAGQLMSTVACDSDGNCTGSCGTNKVCSNNTSQSCSLDSQCPSGGTCIDNKVILKVNNATISGSGVPGASAPYNCTNKVDSDAITCIENNINASNGCNSYSAACKGWWRTITGHKMYSKPFVAGGLVDFTTYQPTSTVCSLGGSAHLWSLHYTTGTPYVQPTIFTYGGTSGTGVNDIEIKASVNLGIGVPPLGESLVALPLAGDTYKVITQVSGGLPGTTISPSLPAKSGYVLWIVK